MFRIYSSLPVWAKALTLVLIASIVINTVWIMTIFFDENSSVQPASGGIHVEASVGSIRHLNPALGASTDAERDLNTLIFAGLQKFDTESGKIVDDLASCTTEADLTKYVCTLKDNLYWQDGEPLTIDDVVFTYKDLLQNPELPTSSNVSLLKDVLIEKTSDKTISFTLSAPNVFFVNELTRGIVPKHVLGLMPASNLKLADFNLHPVGAGPYTLEMINKSEDNHWEIQLKVNERYHGERPNIDSIVLHLFESYQDLAANLSLFNAVKGIPTSETERFEENSRFNVYDYTLPQYVALFLNNDSQILRDARVRFALLVSTNKEEIASFADGEIVDTPFLDDKEGLEIKYDTQHAGAALLATGWKDSDDEGGIRYKGEGEERKDFKLKLVTTASAPYVSNPPPFEQIAKIVQAQWREVGVDVEINILPWEEFNEAVQNRDYDILLFGQNIGQNPDLTPFWHSSAATNGLNFSEFKHFDTDVLLERARTEANEENRRSTFKAIGANVAAPVRDENDNLTEGVAAVFLYTPRFYLAVDKKVKGIELENLTSSSDRFYEIGDWYIREEKQLQEGVDIGKVWTWLMTKF